MGGVSADVVLARAFLSRVAEPARIPVWKLVRSMGPVAAAAAIRAGRVDDHTLEATAARAGEVDPEADLEAAERHGIQLVVPESDEWPHFAFAALEAAALRRLASYEAGQRMHAEGGELIPPLALWARGVVDLAGVGLRSVAIVGARAATRYGEKVARDLAYALAECGFDVVSGGAHGIDAAAHRGALATGSGTVIVSAGGLDRAYPPGNTELFERAAECGLLVSESPPGSAPQRRRFLTRNRLIAALGTGTIVVEAAQRSGAMNTARHARALGRILMAVPGPVTSGQSVGCHQLIAHESEPARLVTCRDDVLLAVGSASDLPASDLTGSTAARGSRADPVASALDRLDPPVRRVFDGFPARGWIGPDRLAVTAGLPTLAVIRGLPVLELSGLVERSAEGYRIAKPARRSPTAAVPP